MFDLINEIASRKKKEKIYIFVIIFLSCLTITSILMFTFFSNYKIEVIMSILGSLVTSIIVVIMLFFIFGLLLPNNNVISFYKKVNNEPKKEIIINDYNYINVITIGKNIALDKYNINNQEYFSLIKKFEINKDDIIVCYGQYIVGKKYEKD